MPVHRLIELVWGEEAPRTAEKTLQSYAARLRKALGPDSIERVGAAYRLQIDPDAVDVVRFQRQLATGRIDDALAEWVGTPLAGLDAPGLAGAVDGLVEQWLGAVEADLERLVGHDPASAVAVLTELTMEHPFREEMWALLMTALYRTGRQADALAAYRRARTHLVEQLGVEPGARLRSLESSILGQDDQVLGAPARAAPVSSPPTGTVTFAFIEIEQAARLWTADRAVMAEIVARHEALVREIATTQDGYVFSTGGDSIGLAFHRAADSTRWAVEHQQAVEAATWPHGRALQIQIGIHTGEAEERTGDYFGPPVNFATSIADAAHGGQILVSEVTAGLIGHVDLHEVGHVQLEQGDADLLLFQLGRGDHPPVAGRPARKGNLPRRTGRLVGREESLRGVRRALIEAPAVTLVGPGGIGKTRLALAAARERAGDLADGAYLVELSDVAASTDVARSVADVLDVVERSGRTDIEAIVHHLQPRELLLVLDNCEHIVDGAADLVAAINAGCPRVAILATSREGLGVADERLLPVGPLAIEEAAVVLFLDRARAANAPVDPEADRSAVEEICRRLDGVPLAIELAAARAKTLTPSDLVDRLDDRLRLLSSGRRRSVERHRTMRATIQWSYDLLTPLEQDLFRRLSVFAGDFDLRAVETVAVDDRLPATAIDGALDDLVGRSMVIVESGRSGRRFRLLETMREFSAELLADEGNADDVACRHARYVAGEVETIGAALLSPDELEAAACLVELWPNVRAAVEWALAVEDKAVVTSIIQPIALQLFIRRGYGEVCGWVERLLAITTADDDELRALCLVWAALHYSMNQRREQLRELLEGYGDPDHVLVRHAYLLGVVDDAVASLEVAPLAAAEMRRRGDETCARLFEMFGGAAMMMAGRSDGAIAALDEAATWFEVNGPPSIFGWTQFLLGTTAAFVGDNEGAERFWTRAMAIDVPPRTNSPSEALSARSAARAGRHREAARILRAYVAELVDVDYMAGVAMVGIEFVNLTVATGRLVDAAVILGHFDTTGLLGVEGPGFKQMIADAVDIVASDPEAAASRAEAAAQRLDERAALAHIGRVLDDMLVDDGGGPERE